MGAGHKGVLGCWPYGDNSGPHAWQGQMLCLSVAEKSDHFSQSHFIPTLRYENYTSFRIMGWGGSNMRSTEEGGCEVKDTDVGRSA